MLTEELRTIILKITEDPLYVKPSAIDIPLKLNRRLREYFITQLRTRKDKYAAQIFNEQIRYDELYFTPPQIELFQTSETVA